MEAPIVFGLKRPASEGLVAGAGTGQRSDRGGTAVKVAALCGAAVAWGRRSSGWLASWAAGRSISPDTLSGISLLLALCAAAWFSGGAHDGGKGMIAMLGWLLVLVAARSLAGKACSAGATAGATADAETAPRYCWMSAVCASAAECAIYGGMAAGSQPTILIGIWPLAVTTLISIATSELLGACWRAALGAGDPGESDRIAAVRRWTGRILGLPAGLRGLLALLAFAAAGAPAALFAVLAVEMVALTATIAMLGKIRPPRWRTGLPVTASPFPAEPAAVWPATVRPAAVRPAAARPAAARSAAAGSRRDGSATAAGASGPPAQAPAARITASAGAAGSPGATAAVRLTAPWTRGTTAKGEGSAASTSAEGSAAAGPTRSAEPSGAAGPSRSAEPSGAAGPSRSAEPSGAAGPSRSAEPSGAARPSRSAEPSGAARPSQSAEATWAAEPAPQAREAREARASVTPGAAAHPVAGQARAQDVILALRDDGAAARWAGRLVQGNLIPLPPAFAGLIATAMLAALGLRNLPGFIALTPPVVMMLAAPGSSHRHDGKFDWLIPVLLALAQYVYLATLGFALAVPGPVVFSACALILVWYASVIASAGRAGAGAAGPGTGQGAAHADPGGARAAQGAFLGWETRMFAIGLAAAMGLATFGYLGLAAYLCVLICRRVITG